MIHTDPLSLLFIASFLFGLLYLVVTALSGSLTHGHGHGVTHGDAHGSLHGGDHAAAHADQATHHHVHTGLHPHTHTASAHSSDSANPVASFFAFVNPTTIVLFLLGFGFFGYVFHNVISFAVPLTLALALVSGMIIAAIMLATLNRMFGDSEGATVQDVADRTGLIGKVSLTIQENSLGEIIYTSPGGMRKSIPARSVDGRRIERDQEVVVVNYQNGVAEIDTWDHFVNQEEAGFITAPDDDELATLRALLEEPIKTDTEYVMRKDLTKE